MYPGYTQIQFKFSLGEKGTLTQDSRGVGN